MRFFTLLLAGCSLTVSPLLLAHETWLSPSTYSSQAGQTIEFHLSSGMNFPKLEFAIRPERVRSAHSRLAGEEAELSNRTAEKNSLAFSRSFAGRGLITAWVTLYPKDIELSDEKVVEYFDEIHPSEQVREAWSRLKGSQKWKEIYTKCAKTCVVLGDAQDDRSWKKPVGMAFELVPLFNPTTLKGGQAASFQLLKNKEPLAHASVGLLADGKRGRIFQVTDAEGRATFPVERAGSVLAFAVDLQLAGDHATWESKFTTFTFEVN